MVWLFLAVFRRSRTGEVVEDLAKVVFGIEADRAAYRCDGAIAVLELLYGDVYSYGVQEFYRGLPELSLKQMVKR